jgi:hypothetical protein
MFDKEKDVAKKILTKKEIDKDKDVELEKGDLLAMAIALAWYMIPAVLGIFALIALFIWFIY